MHRTESSKAHGDEGKEDDQGNSEELRRGDFQRFGVNTGVREAGPSGSDSGTEEDTILLLERVRGGRAHGASHCFCVLEMHPL